MALTGQDLYSKTNYKVFSKKSGKGLLLLYNLSYCRTFLSGRIGREKPVETLKDK